jgi:signal transduction histidine kinase
MGSVDLGALIEETVDSFRDLAKQKQIEIAFMEKTSSAVLGDTSAVRQVLINLISNAVKFSRNSARVRIGLTEEMQWTPLTVKDEGCGIPPNEIPRIFDRFYRATGSEQIKGAGLGLYIAKLLVEAMAGRISVEGTLGTGTSFTVSFQKHSAIRETSPIPSALGDSTCRQASQVASQMPSTQADEENASAQASSAARVSSA